MEALFAWLLANADWLIPTSLLVADKVVAASPTKHDDLIFTALKGALRALGKLPGAKMLLVPLVTVVALSTGCAAKQGGGGNSQLPPPEEVSLAVAQAEAAFETAVAGYELLLDELDADDAAGLRAKVDPILTKGATIFPLLRHAAELYAASPSPENIHELLLHRKELAVVIRDIARIVRTVREG